jgi:predicted negative regulator of RcsB-dependent stress response
MIMLVVVVVAVVVAATWRMFQPLNFNHSDKQIALYQTLSTSTTSHATSKTEQRNDFAALLEYSVIL